ncbi:MAG TPA: OmpA family protein [Cyclobacteriaceae bacterium]|nr:OmpA family protein [Cyclobacteriaceae bacterium]
MIVSFTSRLVRLTALAAAVTFYSCVQRPFVPVNVGREYGNPTTPYLVTHLVEKNKWALARTRPHNIFQQIICFHYPCRKMIGRRKTLQAISMKAFKKRIEKNAKKGAYKHLTPSAPAAKKAKRDTLILPRKDTIRIARKKREAVIAPLVLKSDSLITLTDVLFETNSYKLKSEHFTQLDELSKFLLSHPTIELSVLGHTDNVGDEKHNVALSAKRAESVAQYMINKGIDDERIFFEGFGSSRPITGNDTPQGRSKNRRVEILLRNPSKK